MERSLSWKTDIHLARPEIFLLLWYPNVYNKVYYCVQNSHISRLIQSIAADNKTYNAFQFRRGGNEIAALLGCYAV